MKRFSAVSLLLLLALKALACINEEPTYNNYLYSVYLRDNGTYCLSCRFDEFWRQYAGPEVYTYEGSKDLILRTARRRGDREMVAYLQQLNRFLEVCGWQKEAWDYPSKAMRQRCQAVCNQSVAAARGYRGTRLQPQYRLMLMRANCLMGRFQANKDYWERTGRLTRAGAYRDAMLNLYAGSLLRLGFKSRAIDIYAAQGDVPSLQYCVSKYRNLAGIKAVYGTRPNSPTLWYLVQDFVNNAQETQDIYRNHYREWMIGTDDSSRIGYMNEINARPVFEKEVRGMIAFANQVAASGRTQWPAMWKSAAGCLHYLLGDYATAVAELRDAMTLDGTQRMKDNARAIYLVASAKTARLTPAYSSFLIREFEWLNDKERADSPGQQTGFSNHYTDIRQRMVYRTLVDRYRAAGRLNAATALLGMMEERYNGTEFNPRKNKNLKPDEWHWNSDYRGQYFDCIDSMRPEALRSYMDYLQSEPADTLERYVLARVYRDPNYYRDLMGTKLMARGRWAEAMTYLRQVSPGYLSTENIAPYMARRDYKVEPWLHRQPVPWNYEGPGKVQLQDNPRLSFCRDITQLQSQYSLARDAETRRLLAYRLATLTFQASYLGQCWWLTHYAKTNIDSVRPQERDLVADALLYLNESAKSSTFDLQQRSLYALAYIGDDPWRIDDWLINPKTDEWEEVHAVRPASRQYKALGRLADFAARHPAAVAPYVSRCDVLRQFLAQRLDTNQLP